jgi:hypothetical protein
MDKNVNVFELILDDLNSMIATLRSPAISSISGATGSRESKERVVEDLEHTSRKVRRPRAKAGDRAH